VGFARVWLGRFVGVLVLALLPWGARAEDPTHLTFATLPSGMSALLGDVLKEAYGTLGIDVTVEDYPAQRALQLADTGAVDGEAGRLTAIEPMVRSLLRVPVPVAWLSVHAFTLGAPFPVDGYASLKGHTIGLLRGYKRAETMVAGMRHTLAISPGQLFTMLANGRVDVVILAEMAGREGMRDAGVTGVHMLEPPLEEAPLYHYLHQRHADLVPRVTRALEEMTRSGRLKAIARAHFDRLGPPEGEK
jgi:ABC-type amino acid transport substrate-binding protein